MPKLLRLLLFAPAALIGCQQPDSELGTIPGQPDIILVTVDTLRADHLGCYGYFRDTSPVLDALSKESLLFERCISPMATTLPAHLSLFTGLWPHQHGYVANTGAVLTPFTSSEGRRPISTVLAEAGYQTAAFVSGPTVSRPTGIHSGFDHFDEHDAKSARTFEDRSRPGAATVANAARWLREEAQQDQPLFLWVHLWDPHEPNLPAPQHELFSADSALDELLQERGVDLEGLQDLDSVQLRRLLDADFARRTPLPSDAEKPVVTLDSIRSLYDRYDADVRASDDAVGTLIAALKSSNRWEDSVFCFTADHGQSLGQHDWLEHGTITHENVHVPLLVRFPGEAIAQPKVIQETVSLVDVFPTLLARMELDSASSFHAQAAGLDVLSSSFDRPFALSQRSVRPTRWGAELRFALSDDQWRWYHVPGGSEELYDLEHDPGERFDLSADQPELCESFRSSLRLILNDRPYSLAEGTPDDASRLFLEQLEAFGYTGSK
jgi:arylsulfatase A-like enzyme